MALQFERRHKGTLAQHRSFSVLQTLVNWRVLALAAIHFGQAGVSVGLAVFVAQIIKGLGLSNMQTGLPPPSRAFQLGVPQGMRVEDVP